MITRLLGSIYGGVAARRRAWYARHPEAVRRLARPVVSVGNLRAGGAGKTPVVAAIARELAARGERPSILTRGYGRATPRDGVTVVSTGHAVIADVDAAGDEPLMLARQLPDVPVLVGSDRYLSGRLAERQFGVTVHLLDDGFQHFALARQADLLVADEADLHDELLPAGRLREPLESARAADAALVAGAEPKHVADALGIGEAFAVTRTLGGVPDRAALAVAAIAGPQRFFDDLAAAGARVAATLVFGDHHRFSREDLMRIAARAREADAEIVVTTEKDSVRLPSRIDRYEVVAVPLTATIEPRFAEWLARRIA